MKTATAVQRALDHHFVKDPSSTAARISDLVFLASRIADRPLTPQRVVEEAGKITRVLLDAPRALSGRLDGWKLAGQHPARA